MKKESKTFTYQTRFKMEEDLALTEYGELFGKLERKLFAHLSAKKNVNDLKKLYIAKYGATARQFNSLRFSLKGKMASAQQCQKLTIDQLKEKISRLEKKVKGNKLAPHLLFQKKRSLARIKARLKTLEENLQNGKVSICFGSVKLFRQQFHLEDKTHLQWKSEWTQARNNQFYVIGSKDETAGNQSCALFKEGSSFSIRLRLPHSLEKKFGKYLIINDVNFAYGKEEIAKELDAPIRKAMNYRFLKDKKGWRIFLSFAHECKEVTTKKELGAVGIDINPGCIAAIEIDRYGNKIAAKTIKTNLYGKSKDQSKAILGDAVKEVVELARKKQVPIVLEELNFDKKKQNLKDTHPRHARMLSSFSYRKTIESFESKGFRQGVEIIKVSPAYTSMLGCIKYKKRYGLSTHIAAALCIGRRGMGYLEKLPLGKSIQVLTNEGPYLQLSLPARKENVDQCGMLKEVFKSYKAVHVAHTRAKKSKDP